MLLNTRQIASIWYDVSRYKRIVVLLVSYEEDEKKCLLGEVS